MRERLKHGCIVTSCAIAVAVLTGVFSRETFGATGNCGQPVTTSVTPKAADALYALRAATHSRKCKRCVCDVDGNGAIQAADALRILRMAVGHDVEVACPAGCPPLCTDGIVDAGEGCDDGNAVDTDECPSTCRSAECGDGIVRAGREECDAGRESETCDANCTYARCGDGTHNATAGEACDDHGDSPTCDRDCTAAACGDGLRNAAAGEQCDTSGVSATCEADCSHPVCGDGVRNAAAGEECEDGNLIDGDGCDSNCTLTGCGNGIATLGEVCDTGSASATCDVDCTKPLCGDGLVNVLAGETCEDGNRIDAGEWENAFFILTSVMSSNIS